MEVVRDTITTTLTGAGIGGMVTPGQQQVQICPPRMSTGFFPGGNGTIPLPSTIVSTTGSVVQLSQVPTPTTTTGMAGSTVGGTTIGTGGTAGL